MGAVGDKRQVWWLLTFAYTCGIPPFDFTDSDKISIRDWTRCSYTNKYTVAGGKRRLISRPMVPTNRCWWKNNIILFRWKRYTFIPSQSYYSIEHTDNEHDVQLTFYKVLKCFYKTSFQWGKKPKLLPKWHIFSWYAVKNVEDNRWICGYISSTSLHHLWKSIVQRHKVLTVEIALYTPSSSPRKYSTSKTR